MASASSLSSKAEFPPLKPFALYCLHSRFCSDVLSHRKYSFFARHLLMIREASED
ncbi:hypothetical protein AAZX31_16G100900 [Glycine max]